VTPRVTLMTEIPAPYRIPLFNALAELVELTVVFLRERNPERPYALHVDELRFRRRTLPGFDVTARGRWLVLNRGAARAVRGADCVVLGGWNQPAFWTALAAATLRRVPRIAWVESTDRDRRSGRLEAPKRRLLRGFDAFVAPGSASSGYLVRLGVPRERITLAPNAVDPEIFGSAARTRADGPVRLLGVGRLAPEKGFDTLLEAAEGLPVEIQLAGTGPEEERLRRLAGPNVEFLGHVERDALPALYANADVVVMPSRSDPWGMVLNEAGLAGRPLVSTDAAGAAHELIEDGANGFRVSAGDVEALRGALRRLVDDEPFRAAAGARSRELAARFTPEAWAQAVARAVAEVLA
jgi:glycosyltransferase involved in cell wall biosynthesis